LAKRLGKPWVADFRDPWTLNAYAQKGKMKNILLKIEKFMEKRVYRNSSAVLANTKANRKNLLDAFPWLKADKVIYLPNGWEEFPEKVHSVPKDNLLTIVHAGTFYPRFKPYALFQALAAWREGRQPPNIPPLGKDIRIILLGSRDAETRQVVKDLGIEDWVEFKPWVPLEEARRMMCSAGLLWTSLGTGKESATYVPSKLFEYIAAGKPILGFFHEGDAADLIRDTGTGVVFTRDDPGPVIEFLNRMRPKFHEGKTEDAVYARKQDVIDSFHIRSITGKLADILNRMIKGG